MTGASTVTVTFGNQRRCTWLRDRRENGVASSPSMLHRHDHRAGLVGDQADAVINLHQAAGDGDAPLGEDDQRLAAFTALISVRVAIGLDGSSGIARVSLRNGFTHQRCAMW